MKRFALISALAAVMVLLPLAAHASLIFPPFSYGFGARGIGMGAAYTAMSGDASCAFFNPAAMPLLEHSEIMLSYLYAAPRFEGGPANGNKFTFDTANNMIQTNLALKLNGLFKSNFPLSLGLNISLDENGEAFIRFYDQQVADGYYYRYGPASFVLNLTLGFGITDWLFLGGGALMTLHANNVMGLNTDLAGNTSHEGMTVNTDTALAPLVSMLLHFQPIDIGFSYHGRNTGEFGPMVVSATATVGSSPLANLPMTMFFKDNYNPHRVAGGVYWRVLDNFRIAADVAWFNWNDFDQTVESNDLARKAVVIDFHDIWVPHIGFEYEPIQGLNLRAGYAYEDSPVDVPGSSGNVILDSPKHIGSLGLGYNWADAPLLAAPISFDAAYFVNYLVPTTLTTSDNVDFESSGVLNGGIFTLTLRF